MTARSWLFLCVTLSALNALGSSVVAVDKPPTIIDSVPFEVSAPGSYRLASDLSYPDKHGPAIAIQADDVTLDLQGYSLAGTAGADSIAVGIRAVDRKRISITNGRISRFYFGIDIRSNDRTGSKSSEHRVSRMVLDGN